MNKIDRYSYIWKAIQKHGYKFDYRRLSYIKSNVPIEVGCKEHGFFFVNPCFHLSNKYGGCKQCNPYSKSIHSKKPSEYNRKYNTEWLIGKIKSIHENNLILSDESVYINTFTKVSCHCNKHDIDFEITPHDLIRKHGCPICGKENSVNKRKNNVEEIIRIANIEHNNKYDYSDIRYKSINDYIYPICKEHGQFKVNCYNHLHYHCGCPKCSNRFHYSEKLLFETIKEIYTDAIYNYHNKEILGKQSIDVYIPSLRIGIEYQGLQHFIPISWFGGEKSFNKILERDRRKLSICKDNDIKLLYYSECNIPKDFNEYNVISDKEELFKLIEKERNG